jgi:transglutaminase-like putative cysteine protease
MRYAITHSTTYTYGENVSPCHNQVHLAPRRTSSQECEYHQMVVQPPPSDRDTRIDYFGNQVDYFTILEPHSRLTIDSTSRVAVTPRAMPDLSATAPWETIAQRLKQERTRPILDASQFTYASSRVPLLRDDLNAKRPVESDADQDTGNVIPEFERYAQESFEPGVAIAEGALDLTRRIHADFTFDSKATTLSTPVEVAFARRHGVCQDFAHIQIACLRSLGLAARYVSGYLRTIPPKGQPPLVGADASHAWVSVFCGDLGWVDYDPTNDVMPSDSHITLVWGRDYDDVCPIQGVFLGGGKHHMATSVEVKTL